MNIFKISTLNHMRALQQCLLTYRAEASLNPLDFVVQVRARNRYYTLYPQFLGSREGHLYYSRHLDDAARGFAGWLPYFNKRWPTGSGKFPFKDFCERHGLRTPAISRAPEAGMRDFLVKHNSDSFGNGIRGPFASHDPHDPRQVIDGQGYYESFIRGRIVKGTFWDGRLAAVEIKRMASVVGDGKSTMRELMGRLLHVETPAREWDILAGIIAYEGLKLDSVPAEGRSVLIDFRFGSYANMIDRSVSDPHRDLARTKLLEQLVECGPVLWQGIPDELRNATLFTVDAIIDDQDQLWLLEMNCNPVCHPNVYPLMFETLFGAADTLQEAAPIPATALPAPQPSMGLRVAPMAMHGSGFAMPQSFRVS